MRIDAAYLLCSSLLLFVSIPTLAAPPTPSTNRTFDRDAVAAEKAAADHVGVIPSPIYVNVGGDTIGTATIIPQLPYSDSGNTCVFAHNYDAVCPFTGSSSRDVVYRFTPPAQMAVSVDLCNASYDTKVYIYANAVGNLVACNDDACGSDGWKSLLECVPLAAGSTYYIVVDGYGGECGAYQMSVTECVCCFVSCPPGGVLEGEPDCTDGVPDTYNGGCNIDPPLFTAIPCQEGEPVTMCGTYGGYIYNGLSYRDTDWYTTTLAAPSAVTWCVTGEYDTLFGIIDGNGGCPVSSFYDYGIADAGTPTCLSDNLPAGEWWFFVATSAFGPGAAACGADYIGTLSGVMCGTVALHPTSWGLIKNIYK